MHGLVDECLVQVVIVKEGSNRRAFVQVLYCAGIR
jgi:hypothetical protein